MFHANEKTFLVFRRPVEEWPLWSAITRADTKETPGHPFRRTTSPRTCCVWNTSRLRRVWEGRLRLPQQKQNTTQHSPTPTSPRRWSACSASTRHSTFETRRNRLGNITYPRAGTILNGPWYKKWHEKLLLEDQIHSVCNHFFQVSFLSVSFSLLLCSFILFLYLF